MDPPVNQHAPTTTLPVLSASFVLADLVRVRHEVKIASRRCGLGEDELEDWVTAVNELMINVIPARGWSR